MAAQNTGRREEDGGPELTERFDATEFGARTAIAAVMAVLERGNCPTDKRAEIEIALAEAVNNVVEHAFAAMPQATGQIACHIVQDTVTLIITDNGRPLPGDQLPDGQAVPVDGPREALPEGGFGWFLIRHLADSVSYCREAGVNRLILRFFLPQTDRKA